MSADPSARSPRPTTALVARDLSRHCKLLILPIFWVIASAIRAGAGGASRAAVLADSLPLFSLVFVAAASWSLTRELVIQESRDRLRSLPVDDATIARAKIVALLLLSLSAAAIIGAGIAWGS